MAPPVAASGSPAGVRTATVCEEKIDLSPVSAESKFRELDDVFLQTQARIWLGEVLKIRLNEKLNVSDLLADGELLFEVSGLIWNMLLKRGTEPQHMKAYRYEPFASRKSSGLYTPYSNVESFLKICKIMGLTSIDLFCPSDVVEKKDTRNVCLCIRLLSKRARSKHLDVPDFDIVTYTISMPTDMVGCIRKNLESVQCNLLSSDSCNSSKYLGEKLRQETTISTLDKNYDTYSEDSDEAESNLIFMHSGGSSPIYTCSTLTKMNSDFENTLGVTSAVKYLAPNDNQLQLDYRVPDRTGHAHYQFAQSFSTESVGSVCSQHMDHDDQAECMSSSSCVDSKFQLRSSFSSIYSCSTLTQMNSDLEYVPGVTSAVKYLPPDGNQLHLDYKRPGKTEHEHDQSMQSLSTESARSVSLQHNNHDDQTDCMTSSSHVDSKFHLMDGCSAVYTCGNTNQMNSDLENALEVTSAVKYLASDEIQLQFDYKKPLEAEHACDQVAQSLSTELVGSVCSQHLGHDDESDGTSSSSHVDSKFDLMISGYRSGVGNRHANKVLDICSGPNMGNPASTMGELMKQAAQKKTESVNQLSVDINFHETGSCMLDGDVDTATAHPLARSWGAAWRTEGDGFRRLSDTDDMEVFSTSSLSSMSSVVRNLDFDTPFKVHDIISIQDSELSDHSDILLHEMNWREYGSQEIFKPAKLTQNLPNAVVKASFDTKAVSTDSSVDLVSAENTEFKSSCKSNDSKPSVHVTDAHNVEKFPQTNPDALRNGNSELNADLLLGQSYPLSSECAGQPHPQLEFRIWDQKGKCSFGNSPSRNDVHGSPKFVLEDQFDKHILNRMSTGATGDTKCGDPKPNADHSMKDCGSEEEIDKFYVNSSNGVKDNSLGEPMSKSSKRPLLKSLVRGTAVVGALLLFLHIRKNIQNKTGEPRIQPSQMHKEKQGNPSSQKLQHVHKARSVYPAEKLKL